MTLFNKFFSSFKEARKAFFTRPYLFAALGLALLAALSFLLLRNGNGGKELFTVMAQDFVEDVSIAGTVITAESVDLGFAQSGRIAGVYAKVGDTVPAGALLAQIENGDLRAAVAQKKAAYGKENAKLAALRAGTRPEEIAVSESSVASAEVSLLQTHTSLVDSMHDAYAKSDDVVRNKVDQFINGPRTATPAVTFETSDYQLKVNVENKRVEIEGVLTKWQRSLSALSPESDLAGELAAAQKNLSAVGGFLAEAAAALARAVPATSVTQSAIDGYVSDIATARNTTNTSLSALTAAETARKNALSSLDTAQKNLALKRAGSTKEDVDAQAAAVAAAEAELGSAEAQLRKTLVVAPFSGTVSRMDAKVGAIASANTSDITLMSSGVFQIETFVPEVRVVTLAIGNTATVTLDAYGEDVSFGARVIAIDPARTLRNSISTYKTTLLFNEADPRIRSGMTTNIRVVTAIRPHAIVIPQGALIVRGEENFVAVLRGRNISEVPVLRGATSALGRVEILDGLSPGDTIILNP